MGTAEKHGNHTEAEPRAKADKRFIVKNNVKI